MSKNLIKKNIELTKNIFSYFEGRSKELDKDNNFGKIFFNEISQISGLSYIDIKWENTFSLKLSLLLDNDYDKKKNQQ